MAQSDSTGKRIFRGNQQFLQYYAQIRLHDHWTLLADGGIRFKDGFNETTKHIVRAGLGYQINERTRVVAGLAQLSSYGGLNGVSLEWRPYQELGMKGEIGKVKINHRYRIEQRIFRSKRLQGIGDPVEVTFNWRFRYGITASIPIARLSKENPDKRLLLNIGDEIFINAGSEVVNNIFNQNRVLISPTLQFSDSFSASLTWNSQFSSRSNPGDFNYTDVVWLQLKHKIDTRK